MLGEFVFYKTPAILPPMETELGSLLVSLTILWFVAYWIFGGVVFSIISLLRPGKMKRVRFSCLYSLFSLLIAYGSARLGLMWAAEATGSLPEAASLGESITLLGGLGFVGILLGFIVGLIALFVGGWVIMLISRSKELTWYERKHRTANQDDYGV